MAKITTATFNGKTGKYNFDVFPVETSFNAVGAVYIFTHLKVNPDGKGTHTLLYIGETESLKERIPNHEKWPCVKREDVNCICIHRDDNSTSRHAKEADLIAGNNTPCND